MAQDLITSFSNFVTDATTYGAPRVNARGGKSIKVNDARGNTLTLSTPLILTWGVNKMVDEDTGRVSYTMALQFPSEQYANASTTEFFEKMRALESKILDDAVTNRKAWFNKPKMSREVAEALFTPMLRYPKDKMTGEPDYDRMPTMKIKIPFWEGKFNVELYNMDRTSLFSGGMCDDTTPFESFIPKTSHVAAVIQCQGLWFAAGKFGVTWRLVQAIVRQPVRIKGGCFISLSTEDESFAKKLTQREAEEEAETEVAAELHAHEEAEAEAVEDTDDEEEEEAVAAPPAPKKTARKRKVVKKTTKKKAT